MQDIFDSSFILKKIEKRTDVRLLNEVLRKLNESLEDAKFFYKIDPKEFLNLEYDLSNLKPADCIFAPLILHKINDIDGIFKKIKNSLNQNGIFLGNFFGLSNLQDLGELFALEDVKTTGRSIQRMLPLVDIKTAGNLLQKSGFKNIVICSEEISFNFPNLMEALKFLQNSGESNCLNLREKTLLPGNVLKKYIESFKKEVTLKFDVCFFSCLNI